MPTTVRKSRNSNCTPFEARMAVTRDDMEAIMRLRHSVFNQTFGARFSHCENGMDYDSFDPLCRHLIVKDRSNNQTIATTRLLTEKKAQLIGSFYSENEFILPGLKELPDPILELGRVCIHEDYRNRSAILSLWQALSKVLTTTDTEVRFLIGCASISMDDGGIQAEAIMRILRANYMDTSRIKATPLVPLPQVDLPDNVVTSIPPFLKFCLRLGAKVCGEPSWDRDFGVADVFTLLDLHELNRHTHRYVNRFL
ncbi:GNAT family N-acetyltransferase [Kistimonas asteriae]|uniref:GNAT family N-acetyltransferase n=1 Tax=Kistimonas asteriae TaxID=517724 RepID=UPI001BA8172A|nr:GNAT family N-acetyltransferase [Kistimonas asteriae]